MRAVSQIFAFAVGGLRSGLRGSSGPGGPACDGSGCLNRGALSRPDLCYCIWCASGLRGCTGPPGSRWGGGGCMGGAARLRGLARIFAIAFGLSCSRVRGYRVPLESGGFARSRTDLCDCIGRLRGGGGGGGGGAARVGSATRGGWDARVRDLARIFA